MTPHEMIIRDVFGEGYYVKLQLLEDQSQPITVNVPVGYLPAKHWVSLATISLTLSMALYLGKIIIK